MAFDGLFTRAMTHELADLLVGGRVTKISAPYRNEVILTIRSRRRNYPVLLSAHPSYARAQVTEIPYANPQTPSNFTMVLRKYLESAKVAFIRQPGNDRVINFGFVTRNELGDSLPLLLSLEVMGRYSNLILVDQEKGTIIDTVKHVPMDQNRYRTLLPQAAYRTPPVQDKKNPFEDEDGLYRTLLREYPNREVLAKALVRTYQGLSRESALILSDRLHEPGSPSDAFSAFLSETDHPHPAIVRTEKGDDFTCFETGGKRRGFETLSAMLDAYYREKATKDRVRSQGSRLIHVVRNDLSRNRRKLVKLERELKATENADTFRIKGELLTTYLHQVSRGMTEITLNNYYDNEKPLTIALSNQLSPSANAQKYFKKYQKLKNAVAYVTRQIELTEAEIAYLETVQAQIELAEPQDLPDIEFELEKGGYLERRNAGKKKQSKAQSRPETFNATDGTEISVGKNNYQNDRLTLKTARKDYWWLHVKNVPGSHVIVHSAAPSDETLYEAAMIAAYFSKSRASANVAVDYVQVRRIRKPNGAKPGFVIYEGQKTLYVTPDEEMVEKLKA